MEKTTRQATARHYLMCPPTHFDVTYSINPWMDPGKPADRSIAVDQWQRIHDQLVGLGHAVDIVPPLEGLPDMVFAANSATVYGDRALVARFRFPERDAEFRTWESLPPASNLARSWSASPRASSPGSRRIAANVSGSGSATHPRTPGWWRSPCPRRVPYPACWRRARWCRPARPCGCHHGPTSAGTRT